MAKIHFSIRDLLWAMLVLAICLGWRLENLKSGKVKKIMLYNGYKLYSSGEYYPHKKSAEYVLFLDYEQYVFLDNWMGEKEQKKHKELKTWLN
jgi:hypothetical protein